MASSIAPRATPHHDTRTNRTNLLLIVFDSFVCTDAVVSVRLHAMAHPLDRAGNNDAVVRGVCVVVLPTL